MLKNFIFIYVYNSLNISIYPYFDFNFINIQLFNWSYFNLGDLLIK